MFNNKIMAGGYRWLLATGLSSMFIMPAAAVDSLSKMKIDANAGDVDAQYNLGMAYIEGEDILQNYRVAYYWLLKAAAAEHHEAEYEVGELYKEGDGVEQSYRLASEWFIRSAEQGNADAQHGLGVLYEYGDGVRQSMQKAKIWYKKSCSGGSDVGCSSYKRVNR